MAQAKKVRKAVSSKKNVIDLTGEDDMISKARQERMLKKQKSKEIKAKEKKEAKKEAMKEAKMKLKEDKDRLKEGDLKNLLLVTIFVYILMRICVRSVGA